MPTLDCPFCERPNPEDAKFCNSCGSPLHLKPCKECGAVDDVRAKACYKCGAPFPARVPKVHAEVALQAVQEPASGRLIELFQGTREATTDFELRQPDPPVRTVGGSSRLAAVTRIGNPRRLTQVMLADDGDFKSEKEFSIRYRTAAGAAVVLLLGIAVAATLYFRGAPDQAPTVAAPSAREPQVEPVRPNAGLAGSPGLPPSAAPSASVAAAPRTAALAASPSPQPAPVAEVPALPGQGSEAAVQAAEAGRQQEPAPAPAAGATGNAVAGEAAAVPGGPPPLKPAGAAETTSGKPASARERGTRQAGSKNYRERRNSGKRYSASAGEGAGSRSTSSDSQRAARPPRTPAGTPYRCTEGVSALGLCN